MAVVKMNKFTIIGIDDAAESFMAELMELGVTELSGQESKLHDEEWAPLALNRRRDLEIAEIESKLNVIDNVLKTLGTYDTSKKPLFSARRAVSKSTFVQTIQKDEQAIEEDINIILDLSNRIKELQNTRNKIETAVIGLEPWATYQVPLEVPETKYTYVSMGVVPPRVDIGQMKNALEEVTNQVELALVSADPEQQYISLIYMKEADEEIHGVLKQYGFNKMSFKGLTGSAAENIARYRSEMIEISKKITEVEQGFADMVVRKDAIELFYDYLVTTQDKAKALDGMLATNRTFYIDGWIPAEASENLETLLKQYGCYYEIIAPEKGEETPVLLKNNKLITPIETITELYDLPNSRELDPTPVFSFFYVCFFGIMFADMGYGIILALLSFAAVMSGKLEGNMYKFIKQLGYCGVSTFIWGAIFGSFFGNLIPVVAENFFGRTVTITPLWIDPVQDSMTMLIFACLCGVVHIFVALGVKAYAHLREGRVLDAINDSVVWYALLIGLGLLIAGDMLFDGASQIGQWLSITGVAGVLILPIFMGKGINRLLGLWNLYGITRYLSDILSYARLLALCLAGSVIAQVFNTIASMPGSGVIGVICFIVIVLFAHVFNFLVSALGSFVHSIRLQYVEFFSKFYEGGGIPFKPFMNHTKYVKIVKEEN
ncbi:MAG: V-type ATP synthase subunit I [Clostridiales bacterium]|nr:V-type ATP synthase subunit I [Clostridiales bacterium]